MNHNPITVESLAASDIFQKYCIAPDPQNVEYWENWLLENQHHRDTFEEAKELVQTLTFQLPTEEVQEAYNTFQKNINSDKSIPKKRGINKFLFFRYGVAAAILLLAAVFLILNNWSTPHLQELVTDFGKTKNIELPDGSKVILNANSNIRFTERWNKNQTREVWLNGEAYFDVKHSTAQAFIVHTEKGDIEVLGTKFNVMQRSEDFNVTLVSGKIQLELPNKTKINLLPNDQVSINKQTIDHIQVDVESTTAWSQGKIIFKNSTIQNVITRLQNDFGWNIEVKNKKLLQRKINASIQENNPALLLEALSAIYDLKIKKIDDTNYIFE